MDFPGILVILQNITSQFSVIYSASERQGATIWLLVLILSLPVGDVYVVTALQSVL